MKKIIISSVILIMTLIAIVITDNKNQLDIMLETNIEALASLEKYDVKVCYISGSEGPWETGFYCNSLTSASTLYSCPGEDSYGHKAAPSFCVK